MIMRPFGNSKLRVSAVGLGCNNFGGRIDRQKTESVIDAALDTGINFFDTADVYGERGGSESLLGQILGPRRKDIILATKFGLPMDDEGRLRGGSRSYIMSAVEASLKRLRTEWIDIYYLHRPDSATPIEETLTALDDLIRQGKVRYIGCSNLSGLQLAAALDASRAKGMVSFIAAQDEYNILSRAIEKDVLPVIEREGLALVPYFPLASGMLTGKYRKGQPFPTGTRLANARFGDRFVNERNFEVVERLEQFCAAHNRTLLELAFGWLLTKPSVASVIAGATSPEQVRTNAAALGWTLNKEEMEAVDRIAAL
jgi:aryl-alcohol dehydrogenase-like predicted oxidoreductase